LNDVKAKTKGQSDSRLRGNDGIKSAKAEKRGQKQKRQKRQKAMKE